MSRAGGTHQTIARAGLFSPKESALVPLTTKNSEKSNHNAKTKVVLTVPFRGHFAKLDTDASRLGFHAHRKQNTKAGKIKQIEIRLRLTNPRGRAFPECPGMPGQTQPTRESKLSDRKLPPEKAFSDLWCRSPPKAPLDMCPHQRGPGIQNTHCAHIYCPHICMCTYFVHMHIFCTHVHTHRFCAQCVHMHFAVL